MRLHGPRVRQRHLPAEVMKGPRDQSSAGGGSGHSPFRAERTTSIRPPEFVRVHLVPRLAHHQSGPQADRADLAMGGASDFLFVVGFPMAKRRWWSK
jgi:hypothetical protein